MDAKEYLESYAALKMEVCMHEDRIFEVFNETQMPSISLGNGSQRTPVKDRQEKANIRYIETKDRLQQNIDANIAKMRRIDAIIDRMRTPLFREILRVRYTDTDSWTPLKWSDVSMRIYGDDDEKNVKQTQRKARKALREFAAAMEEMEAAGV